MSDDKGPDEVLRELRHLIQTEGIMVGYKTAIEVCKDPKAPAPAKATMVTNLFRVAGLFEKHDGGDEKEPSEMTAAELTAEMTRIRRNLASRKPKDDDEAGGVFD